jgi:hypothetical protein
LSSNRIYQWEGVVFFFAVDEGIADSHPVQQMVIGPSVFSRLLRIRSLMPQTADTGFPENTGKYLQLCC